MDTIVEKLKGQIQEYRTTEHFKEVLSCYGPSCEIVNHQPVSHRMKGSLQAKRQSRAGFPYGCPAQPFWTSQANRVRVQ